MKKETKRLSLIFYLKSVGMDQRRKEKKSIPGKNYLKQRKNYFFF